jgi:hypothetical protein
VRAAIAATTPDAVAAAAAAAAKVAEERMVVVITGPRGAVNAVLAATGHTAELIAASSAAQ